MFFTLCYLLILLKHGANLYYTDDYKSLLEIAIWDNYVNLTKYIFAHVELKKYYTISRKIGQMIIEKGVILI